MYQNNSIELGRDGVDLSSDEEVFDEKSPLKTSAGGVHWAANLAWWVCCPAVICCSWMTVEQVSQFC